MTGLGIDISTLNATGVEAKDKSKRSQTQSNLTSRGVRYGRKKKRVVKKKKQPYISFEERATVANEALDLGQVEVLQT